MRLQWAYAASSYFASSSTCSRTDIYLMYSLPRYDPFALGNKVTRDGIRNLHPQSGFGEGNFSRIVSHGQWQCFTSVEFGEFMDRNGIRHVKTAPYLHSSKWPRRKGSPDGNCSYGQIQASSFPVSLSEHNTLNYRSYSCRATDGKAATVTS